MRLRKILILILTSFFVLNTQANTPQYFPAEIQRLSRPVELVVPSLAQTRMELTLLNSRPIPAWDSHNRQITLPSNTQMVMDVTLDQIYRGFRKPQFENLFSRDASGETFAFESPEALQFKSILTELIQMKMEERYMERFESRSEERAEKSKEKRKKKEKEIDELVEVTVKKENNKEEKIKVDLKKAQDAGIIDVQDEEFPAVRMDSDYDGSKNWTVKKTTEGFANPFRCFLCNEKKDDVRNNLEAKALSQFIQDKYGIYSKNKKVAEMVNFAKKNKRDPDEYRRSSLKWCYRYVKNALVKAELVSQRPEGVSARYAGRELAKEGFINIMDDPTLKGKIKDPAQAPKGAILVYDPNPQDKFIRVYDSKEKRSILRPDYGHVEIKTEHSGIPGFVSDYYSENARTGQGLESKDRKLIGIYVKTDSI